MKNSNYAWGESYVQAVLETIPGLSSFKFAKLLAAIEERRLSPVETEEERRALENAWEGVRALISESTMKLV